jgi:hypothetical protein
MTTGGFFAHLTWTCMICGLKRSDARISVFKRVMSIGDHEYVVNVRHCNDGPGCLEHAKRIKNMRDLKRVPDAPK